MVPIHRRTSSTGTLAAGTKSTLFCPSCDHASPVDGDWRTRTRAEGTVVSCPSCGADLTVRRTDRTGVDRGTVAPFRPAAGRYLSRSVEFVSTWLTWPYSLASDRSQ